MDNARPHESSNDFSFVADDIGHLTKECVMDRLAVMLRNERGLYSYDSFLRGRGRDRQHSSPPPNPMFVVDPDWRASVAKWSYNVVDHLDLSRELVALSMSLFDRFFATMAARPSSDLVLLTSIASLHIAIKLREPAIIRLSSLSWLPGNRFPESQIAQTELRILTDLRWLANAPTSFAFVMHLLLLLPDNVTLDSRMKILESCRFFTELSVTDAFFVSKRCSVVGLAAIINSLDEFDAPMLPAARARYLGIVSGAIGIQHDHDDVLEARLRLRLLSEANGG